MSAEEAIIRACGALVVSAKAAGVSKTVSWAATDTQSENNSLHVLRYVAPTHLRMQRAATAAPILLRCAPPFNSTRPKGIGAERADVPKSRSFFIIILPFC